MRLTRLSLVVWWGLGGGAAFAAPAEGGWSWHESLTPHFRILHQSVWLPSGLTMGLERINFRLRMDLGLFGNWSSKGRVDVYLYQDQRSYVSGRFNPPPWSDGLAIFDRNAVAVPSMKTPAQLLRVLAHENTHLVFVQYFRQAGQEPPHWLNEGLAMLEEADSPTRPETSLWYQNMAATEPRRWMPLDRFFALSPIKDLGGDKDAVALFYVQSYSVTRYLMREHSHLQFKAFCDRLREGKSVPDALRLAYHYRDTADFEKRWRAWATDPAHKRRVAALPASHIGQNDGVIDQAGPGDAFWGASAGWKFKPLKIGP